jgi:short-subunit dehydrogenase involved in D-alanine esterification of teichoic acids
MRTILISGASRGIGLNIAHKELKEGNRISVGIRDLESLKGSAIDPKKNGPKGKL